MSILIWLNKYGIIFIIAVIFTLMLIKGLYEKRLFNSKYKNSTHRIICKAVDAVCINSPDFDKTWACEEPSTRIDFSLNSSSKRVKTHIRVENDTGYKYVVPINEKNNSHSGKHVKPGDIFICYVDDNFKNCITISQRMLGEYAIVRNIATAVVFSLIALVFWCTIH